MKHQSIILLHNNVTHPSSMVGGKGSNLLMLTKLKYTVPPGFILSTLFYEDVMRHTILSSLMKKMNKEKNLITVLGYAKQIRHLLLTTSISKLLQREIYKTFDLLCLDAVSVRSSTTVEDGLCYSFAGLFETYLHVKRKDIVERIIDCWISTYSERVVKYMVRSGIPLEKLKPAVIIQKMITPDKAGVIFTRNVYTGNNNELLIESCDGLGNQVVDAQVAPSRYVVQKNTRKIIHSSIGFPATGLLNLINLRNLAQVALSIECNFGYSQDIEWALVKDIPYILQTRPIAIMHDS